MQPSDVFVRQLANSTTVEFVIAGTNDRIAFQGYDKGSSSNTLNPLQQVRFADATVWGVAEINAFLLSGTPGDDYITGGAGNDVIRAHDVGFGPVGSG